MKQKLVSLWLVLALILSLTPTIAIAVEENLDSSETVCTRAKLAELIYANDSIKSMIDSIGGSEPDFTDISTCTEAQQTAIKALAKAGVLNGASASTFNPEGNVNRAEAVVILWRATGCKSHPTAVESSPYTDVTGLEWYAPAVLALTAAGIIQGTGDGSFSPYEEVTEAVVSALLTRYTNSSTTFGDWNQGVSRVEMLVEAYQEYKDSPVLQAAASNSVETHFEDIAVCTDEEQEAIEFFAKLGIINGYNPDNNAGKSLFGPYAAASNAQIAVFLQRCAQLNTTEIALLSDDADPMQTAINAAFEFLTAQGVDVAAAKANPHAPGLTESLDTWNTAMVPQTPTFSLAAGTYTAEQTVAINAAEEDGNTIIYYTVDGTEPSIGGSMYESPISVGETTTLKAVSMRNNLVSETASSVYTIVTDAPADPLWISATPTSLTGGGTVTLTTNKNVDTIICSNADISVYGSGTAWTAVLPNVSGDYTFTASINSSDAETASCVVSVTRYYSSGNSSSGSSNTTTTTEKNPDGSTTKTATNKTTGIVTQTTTTIDGTTSKVVTDAEGTVTDVSVNVSSQAIASGQTVTLPVEFSTEEGIEIDVSIPGKVNSVTVEIPVINVSTGAVAVIVHTDGTEEIIKTSVVTEGGVALTLKDDATIKVIDNSKEFVDTAGHWAEDSIDFVSARELFSGTAETTFAPESPMTRAMLMVVLARYDGHDTTVEAGQVWYTEGVNWAIENGISDGSAPNSSISREQLVTMLWRYAGSPESNRDIDHYHDYQDVNDYAVPAMAWAVETGVITGTTTSELSPGAASSRAQLATILTRFINNQIA